jgi:hypothetical protein
MGANLSSTDESKRKAERVAKAFASNDCVIKHDIHKNNHYGCVAETNVKNYVSFNASVTENIRNILERRGPNKCVIYASGDPYTMGYMVGSLVPKQVEAISTFVRHIPAQFVANDIDHMALTAPVVYQIIYKALTQVMLDLLTQGTVAAFYKAIKQGDIPERFLDEMKGLYDGAVSGLMVTPLTLETLIVANYGIDFLIGHVYSGRLQKELERAWDKLPDYIHKMYPNRPSNLVTVPDMCNAAMISGTATKSGQDAYLIRDFQFANAHIYHRFCTIMIRKPTGFAPHLAVGIPGMVGCVTYLNAWGVAGGMNMVRSSAIDLKHLGLGCILTLRVLADEAKSSQHVKQLLRRYNRGVPWIYYAIDKTGDSHIYETIPNYWDTEQLYRMCKKRMPKEMWNSICETTDYTPGTQRGVRDRQNESKYPVQEWSHELLSRKFLKKYRWSTKRWSGSTNYLFDSWSDELEAVADHQNMYFPPYRYVGPGVKIATNNFLYPVWRTTQMNRHAALAELSSWGNQWRYDTMAKDIKTHYGEWDKERCLQLAQFLSPWKYSDYPQNTGATRQIPIFQQLFQESNESENENEEEEEEKVEPVGFENSVGITGSLSVVDIQNMTLYNKSGYWGNDFYHISLQPFII